VGGRAELEDPVGLDEDVPHLKLPDLVAAFFGADFARVLLFLGANFLFALVERTPPLLDPAATRVRSNMRLFTVVSMLKTLRCLFASRPIRVTLVARALFGGSM
jgi:hypothetical protein